MSRVTDLAEEEAARVEAEEEAAADEEPTEPESEPESPTAEPAAPDTSIDMEAVEKAHATFLRAVSRIVGEQADQLEPCPTCSTWPFAGFKPFEAAPPLRDLGDTEECPSCNGYGLTLTASRIPEQRTKPCVNCSASGYRTKPIIPETVTLPTIVPQAVQTEPYPGYGIAFVPVPNGTPDGYGRPAGHPHWGMSREYSTVTKG